MSTVIPEAITFGTEQLQKILAAIPMPLFLKDMDGRILLMNQACEEAWGMSLETLRGTLGEACFSPDRLEKFLAKDKEALEIGTAQSSQECYWNHRSHESRLSHTVRSPVFNSEGKPKFLLGAILDVTDQESLQQQIDSDRRLLELLLSGAPIAKILEQFCISYEADFPGITCSILLLSSDGAHLHHGAGPSLPLAYKEAIDGIAIGPAVGSCGTAVYQQREVLVSDIPNSQLWTNFRELALSHNFHACWSVPIFSTKHRVLGTFAIYHTSPRTPKNYELLAIRRGAYLTGLAIENHLIEQQMLDNQKTLREAALHTQAILDNMAEGVVTFDTHGEITSFNKAASHIFGYTSHEVIGRNVQQLFLYDNLESFSFQVTSDQEIQGRHKGGKTFPMSIATSSIMRNEQAVFIAIVRDITQNRQNEEEIRRLAFYDSLTLLPNRRLLMDRLKQAMSTAARTGQHGAVMFLDLDHFKVINDSSGHDVGDELLQQVAARLKGCVRDGDSVARLGGDEFVVLLEGLSTQTYEAVNQTEVIANRILKSLGQSYMLRGHVYNSTPSIGIVIFMEDSEGMEDLLKKADVAMYQAKSAGRNTARFFDPNMQATAAARAALEKDMRRGLNQNEFVLFYQIQVNSSGSITGVEALVRWKHVSRGMVSPAQFIPLAEETGLILPLGQWVLESACQQLVEWSQNPDTAHWTVSVNVSASQFTQPTFVDNVLNAIKKTGANPYLLKLELTESMLVKDVEDIIKKMNRLKAVGVGFSLDDFGTGYSSLLYLKLLPLDQLKIDQSFVRDLLTDASDAMIARTIVALGQNLGLMVIAEGVETHEHHAMLTLMGCNAFQGYYFGRPVSAQALNELIPKFNRQFVSSDFK